MVADGRIRFLLLDDNPKIVNALTHCPSFVTGCGPGDEAIYTRNFHLSWLYSRAQMKRYFYRLGNALALAPQSLLGEHRYPNLILFDYSLDRELQTRATIEGNPDSGAAYAELDPLAGTWGMTDASERLSAEHPAFSWDRSAGIEKNFDGCFAGALISLRLRNLASVGVPQTVHSDDPATDFFEWMLDEEMRGAFGLKTGGVVKWQVFLAKALPRLRRQVVDAVRSGDLTPSLKDIWVLSDRLAGGAGILDLELRLTSAVGTESLRVEGLFLDRLYRLSVQSMSLETEPMELASDDIDDWLQQLLQASLVGRYNLGELRETIRNADTFIAAYVSSLHEQRRLLSRDLIQANGDKARAERVAATYDRLIRRLGLDPQDVIDACVQDNVQAMRCPASVGDIRFLGTLKDHAPGYGARYLAIALAVWAEMAARGLASAQTLDRVTRVIAHLRDESADLEDILADLEALEGVLAPKLLRRLRDCLASEDPKLEEELRSIIQARLGQFEWALGFGYLHSSPSSDETETEGWPLAAASQNEMLKVMQDIMAPAPRRLLMWRDMKDGRGDVIAPLQRLETDSDTGERKIGLELQDLVLARHRSSGGKGLLPGEGRLIALFAAHYGFAAHHWPAWMHQSVRV